jgi:hypothetical protein
VDRPRACAWHSKRLGEQRQQPRRAGRTHRLTSGASFPPRLILWRCAGAAVVLEGVGGCGGSDAGGEEERARALHVTAGFGEAMQVTEGDASDRAAGAQAGDEQGRV